ncbi:S8 family serine peptidase [Pedobacter sp. MR2016-24]|uniref:S8 family serine peptidase n=1 Tax=Pedobacter sp. MR2016-24 TaxID=2994466 RepID=UPI0022467842|nr:S8 family serine peptidase [Pedobacter sp. MR2016-24]MCX2483389.1 S8 family serine peptidase [Pedobacter sp. MR2016-24]
MKNTSKIINLLTLLLFLSLPSFAQDAKPTKGWQNLDLEQDGYLGISTYKAEKTLLNGKTAVPIVVAIIDGGVDIDHPGISPYLWTNKREIPGNGIDDDHNGFVDDIHGWNFLGDGKYTFHYDNKEIVRKFRAAYKADSNSLETRTLKSEIGNKVAALKSQFALISPEYDALMEILKELGSKEPTLEKLRSFKYKSEFQEIALVHLVRGLQSDPEYIENFTDKRNTYKNQIDYYFNVSYDPRRGNTAFSKKKYGNNNVKGLEPSHGTHVAGIIPSVCKNAKLMIIRTIPDGDPLDQDVASSIRYAVDNGARIINMSTGKSLSMNKEAVDDAVRYAMSKDVLIVHAAGNAGIKIEQQTVFPNRYYQKGGLAQAWIEVGASGPKKSNEVLPWFSNYSKQIVDVFAPGVDIYSTFPNNRYKFLNGTSMAAPVVSGAAALIMAYNSTMGAVAVKKLMLESVIKLDQNVNAAGESISFDELSLSGGIVNVFKVFNTLFKK